MRKPEQGNPAMRTRLLLVAMVAIAAAACAHKVSRTITDPLTQQVPGPDAEYLKAHMLDGELVLLSSWRVAESERQVEGYGTRFDFNREVIGTGDLALSLDSVALFETNTVRVSSSVLPLAVLTVGSIGMTVFCISNPKACFGSCPTFYEPGEVETILAEGFSASIAPSLEDSDLDALPAVRPDSGQVRLVMKNEALETHVIRWADLIAVRRSATSRVFAMQDGSLARAEHVLPPTACRSAEGDCISALSSSDGIERWSLADSTDLATRETIELVFNPPAESPRDRLGVLVVSRQSLLPTFILYQSLAFMGSRATDWLAALERRAPHMRDSSLGLADRMGGIEIQVLSSSGGWVSAGTLRETGPLASDARVVPIPRTGPGPLSIRLVLTRGMWRIDQTALVMIGPAADPVRVKPSFVLRDGAADRDALDRLRSRERQLTTLPGDEYTLVYRLPDAVADYEIFLESRGYYLEWMRAEWIAEEDVLRAAQLFLDPVSALRVMAPEYKRVEADMERTFWSSKYVRAN